MKINSITKLWAWSLGILLLCALPADAQKLYSPLQKQNSNQQEVLGKLAKADIVYLGEIHDREEDHKAQLEIIQQLYQRNRKLAIAMEMFQRPYQGIINRYLASKITETELLEQTQYQQRWGFPWKYYAPIVQFAKAHRLPVVALNTPTEVTRKVARQGLESLTPQERRYIPPKEDIRTDNAEYRQMLLEAYQQHQQGGHGSSTNFERFLQAQVLWDETMAEAIVQFRKANPDYQIVVLVGQGHIGNGYGIPSCVSRRLASKVIQKAIFLDTENYKIQDLSK